MSKAGQPVIKYVTPERIRLLELHQGQDAAPLSGDDDSLAFPGGGRALRPAAILSVADSD